jgi:hypothetical protein
MTVFISQGSLFVLLVFPIILMVLLRLTMGGCLITI